LGATSILDAFLFVEPPAAGEAEAAEASEILVESPKVRGARYGAVEHPLFASAIRAGEMPETRAMALAGHELAARNIDAGDLDELISAGLDAETELFYAIRERVLQPAVDALVAGGASVTEVLEWAQRQHQSARSRRGDSLQNHLATILRLRGIPHTAQCRTEGNRTPDFVIPGCSEYHESMFPADALRMVACKSTVRERWPQILLEAARIPEKYLLTLDARLSDDTIRDMNAVRLRLFLPMAIMSPGYDHSPERRRLSTVGELINELERASS